jgi:hypothetical protein
LIVALATDSGGEATEPLGDPAAVAEDFSTPPVAVKHPILFRDANDPDYQAILTHIRAAGARLREIKRFDMPGFRPGQEYMREMCRYGILPPESLKPSGDACTIDPYETDRRYWEMMYPAQ